MINSDQIHVAMTKMSGSVATLICQSNAFYLKEMNIKFVSYLYDEIFSIWWHRIPNADWAITRKNWTDWNDWTWLHAKYSPSTINEQFETFPMFHRYTHARNSHLETFNHNSWVNKEWLLSFCFIVEIRLFGQPR